MKKLFVVKHKNSLVRPLDSDGKPLAYFWESKAEAKEVRDEHNAMFDTNEFHVSRGPDNLKSPKPNHRSVSTRKHSRWSI